MTYISKRVRRERREKAELVENAIIILFMHFTHSMVLSPEQFNAVVMALGEGLISVNQERPLLVQTNPIEDMEDLLFESKFRFTKQEVGVMVGLMQLPDRIVLPRNYTCSGTTMLLVVLFRLASPTTLLSMETYFGQKLEKISRIFNNGIAYLFQKYNDRLLLDLGIIDGRKDLYCQAISNMCGQLLLRCFGFIDASLMRCCRPIVFQEAVYNGHKRGHGLKFQSVLLPDGLIGHLFGPVEGRRHDTSVLEYSGLLNNLQQHFPGYYLFGDQGYPIHASLISPFRGHNRTPEQVAWNGEMSRVRISVEWGFHLIGSKWAHLQFAQQQKILLVPTAKTYLVAGMLTNIHNCFHPNQVSQYFGLEPPTVEEYLRM